MTAPPPPPSQTDSSESVETSSPNPKIGDHLRRRFIAGLLVVIPVVILIFAITFSFRQIDNILGEHIRGPIANALDLVGWPRELAHPISICVSIFLLVTVIILIGGLTRFLLVRRLIGLGETIINKVPLLRFFYQTPKEVITILTERKQGIKRVVMVQYPKENTWAMAYVTSEILRATDNTPMVSVFIPTTPNPTSGFMLLYPADEVLDINIEPEDAVRMIISGGILSPERFHTVEFAGIHQKPKLPPSLPLTSADDHQKIVDHDHEESLKSQ